MVIRVFCPLVMEVLEKVKVSVAVPMEFRKGTVAEFQVAPVVGPHALGLVDPPHGTGTDVSLLVSTETHVAVPDAVTVYGEVAGDTRA